MGIAKKRQIKDHAKLTSYIVVYYLQWFCRKVNIKYPLFIFAGSNKGAGYGSQSVQANTYTYV